MIDFGPVKRYKFNTFNTAHDTPLWKVLQRMPIPQDSESSGDYIFVDKESTIRVEKTNAYTSPKPKIGYGTLRRRRKIV